MKKLKKLKMGESGGRSAHWKTNKWSQVEYTENVFVNILSKLPVESLLACKSISKHWHQVISRQSTIDSQLLGSKNQSTYIVYPFRDNWMELSLVENDEITKTVTFPECDNHFPLTIISSFDGLLCSINYCWKKDFGEIVADETDLEIRICNPATGKALLLPKGSPSIKTPSIGVAFGPKINEYKIFRIFVAKHRRYRHLGRPQCEVYSSSTGSWSILGRPPRLPMTSRHNPMGSNHIFVNGSIYWFIASGTDREAPGSILSLDMEGNFGTIEIPVDDDYLTDHAYLINLEGHLSLVVVFDGDAVVNTWVLLDGNKWKVVFSEEVPFGNNECTEFVVARGREIFFITTNYYFIYNLDNESWRELDLPDIWEKSFPAAFEYTESILSCGGRSLEI